MAELPRGTVTLVFTDIEGSTRLLASLGSGYEEVLASHRRLLREAFRFHGGLEVDTQGDAFFFAFSRATDAVMAAAEAQRALESHPWPDSHQVRVRIGLHSGEPQVTDEGYVGEDVHIGARIGSAAHGGQVLLSDATERLLPGMIEGIGVRDLSEHGLKDLAARQHLYQLEIEGLSNDFPPIRTLDGRPNNLPRKLTVLIGRAHEVQETCSLLRRDDIAVLTLTGPGGTGKTRLALEVAAELLDDFPQGVFFVDLSTLTDSSLMVSSVSSALSLRESLGRTIYESLEDYLSDKRILLVLDNFEQVVGAAAQVAALLASATELKMLITSREPLHVGGEREFPVPPLSVPSAQDWEEVASSPAVVLFVERAEAVKPGFRLTRENAVFVAEICQRLDGLPLAIELAAARTKLLSPDSLLRRLDQSLKLLGGARRDGSERQRTLRNAIAWSYDSLSDDEQILFRRLGVFAAGWALDAAEAVCDRGDPSTDILDGLASLVDKSLVRAREHEDRFAMLETIRAFAVEELEASGEAEEIRAAHAEYFRKLAEESYSRLAGSRQVETIKELTRDSDNLRAALGWALGADPRTALSLSSNLWRLWRIQGRLTEARRLLQECLALASGPHDVRARALRGLSVITEIQHDYATAQTAAQEATSLFEQLGDEGGIARCLEILAGLAEEKGDLERATRDYVRTRDIYAKLGDEPAVAVAIGNLANVALLQEDYDSALELGRKSIQLHSEHGDKEGMAGSLIIEGLALLGGASPSDSVTAFRRALSLALKLQHKQLCAVALEGLAAETVLSTNLERAAHLLGAAISFRNEEEYPRDALEERIFKGTWRVLDEQLGRERLDQLLDEGQADGMRITDLEMSPSSEPLH